MTTTDTLSPEQTRAAHSPIGPTMVIAGPGSGKTRVVAARVDWMIRAMRIDPESIAIFTFTNRAAAEMQERIRRLLGNDITQELYAGTFHAWGARFLRQYHADAGLPESFTISDQDASLDVVRQALHNIQHPHRDRARTTQDIAHQISRWKNTSRDPDQMIKRWTKELSKPPDKMGRAALRSLAFREYENIMNRNSMIDFDDLINLPLQVMSSRSRILEEIQETIEHVIVDEYQDTSKNQHQLATTLANRPSEDYPSIFIVGDTDQAIYAFRNADIKNLTQFQEKDYPSARALPLNDNYRSTPQIITAAEALIDRNKERFNRHSRNIKPDGPPIRWIEAKDPDHEAELVVQAIQNDIAAGGRFHDHCVAYRTNPQSRPLEEAFRNANIAYVIAGNQEFYKRPEIRFYLDYLHLTVNRHNDAALKRIINTPNRSVTKANLDFIIDYSHQQQISLRTTIHEITQDNHTAIPSDALRNLWLLTNHLDELEEMAKEDDPIFDFIKTLSDKVGLKDHFNNHRDGAQMMPNVVELEQIADLAHKQTVKQFLERTIVNYDSRIPQEQRVTLSTIHQTKGLEFPSVFIIGAEQGLLPSYRSVENPDEIEEERRLMYVGITRAEHNLTITWCRHRPTGNPNRSDYPSRSEFVDQLPDSCWSEPLDHQTDGC